MWFQNLFKKKQKNLQNFYPGQDNPDVPPDISQNQITNPVPNTKSSPPDQLTSRQIRIFISSTFLDMQEEREILIKTVFPKLRRLCEKRYVNLVEVDLRWGISAEEKEQNKVLPICLDEIKRCHPFFIGILGERYGWVPDKLPNELAEKETWLQKYRTSSVTELEIVYGVLENPAMDKNAFFYFRCPEYVADKDKNIYSEPDENNKTKLNNLKEKIKDGKYRLEDNYENPETLGNLVLRDLTEIIESQYPEIDVPLWYERKILEHNYYAATRFNSYIKPTDLFEKLDEFADSKSKPLIITGTSGIGKSALIANWLNEYEKKHSGINIYSHYCGATNDSTNPVSIMKRLMTTFNEKYKLNLEIPEQNEKVIESFSNSLFIISSIGKTIISIDALDRIDNSFNALDFDWLPAEVPENLKLIVSIKSDEFNDKLKEKNWQIIEIKPLSKENKLRLTDTYLSNYRKKLDTGITELIASTSVTDNTLFLRTLLEELRIFGSHEKLETITKKYLKADNCIELFSLIIERYQIDYEQNYPGLIELILSAIACSESGLLENEIIAIIDSHFKANLSNEWFTFYSASYNHFIVRDGLITFGHNYFRQAVADKFQITGEKKKAIHAELSVYFEGEQFNYRKLTELPYQYINSENWKGLKNILTDDEFLVNLWDNKDNTRTMTYWSLLEENTDYNIVDEYNDVLEKNNYSIQFLGLVSTIFSARGHYSEAISISNILLKSFKDDKNEVWNYQNQLGGVAQIYTMLCDFTNAIEVYHEQKRICEENNFFTDTGKVYSNLSHVYSLIGKIDTALDYAQRSHKIHKKENNYNGLIFSLSNIGYCYLVMNRKEEAMKTYKEQEKYAKMINNAQQEAYSLGNQAIIIKAEGRYDEALKLQKKKEEICRRIGDLDGVQVAIGNQANIYIELENYNKALELHKEKERICREKKWRKSLTYSLCSQALLYEKFGDAANALRCLKEEEEIARELGLVIELSRNLVNQARMIYRAYGEKSKARQLAEEGLEIARENNLHAHYNQLQEIVNNIFED